MTISKWVGREHISLIDGSDMRHRCRIDLCVHMVISGRTCAYPKCPLLGEKRTSIDPGEMSAYDPKRTPQPHYKMLGYPFHRRSPWRGHMRRREFIAGTAATAAMGFAQPICAQTNARPGVKRIAIFHPTDPPKEITSNANRVYKAYFDELKKHGYIEGQNLIVERYSALGHPDRIGDLAREIVANHPDVVLPLSAVFLREMMALHSFIPMVGPTADPVAFGFTSNLAKPDKHFTGVVLDAGLEIWAKRFQLLFETARKMTKLGFLNANPLAWGKGLGACGT